MLPNKLRSHRQAIIRQSRIDQCLFDIFLPVCWSTSPIRSSQKKEERRVANRDRPTGPYETGQKVDIRLRRAHALLLARRRARSRQRRDPSIESS